MDTFEFEELVAHLVGADDDQWDNLAELFFEKYELDMDAAHDFVRDLVPLCTMGNSPLTGKSYRGFATNGVFIVKQKVDDD